MPVCKRNQGGKASPMKSKLTIFDNLVYAVLFVVMVAEIAIGPLKQLMDDETKFVKEKVDASKVRFPTVSLCKFNGFRCGFHSGRCPDRESWSSLKDVLDNSFSLKDFYEGATVAPNILDNLITDEDNETVRIDESLWERRPQDLKTTGFCHTLNLDKIMFRDLRANNVKIELKERFKEAKSIEQGPGPNSSYATGYLLTLYEKDDDIMAGINFMDDIDARTFYLEEGIIVNFHVEPMIENRIFNCEPDEANHPLTRCVRNALDRELPLESCPSVGTKPIQPKKCPLSVYRSRTDRLNQFRAEGYSAFRRRTGCRIPCSRHVYRVQEDFRMHNKEFVQERRTVISLQFFKAQEITNLREVQVYGPTDFLSDVGGLSGLMLGLSAWGLYTLGRRALERTLSAAEKVQEKASSLRREKSR